MLATLWIVFIILAFFSSAKARYIITGIFLFFVAMAYPSYFWITIGVLIMLLALIYFTYKEDKK